MDKYGDRIVDWYFNRDDGIPEHVKANQLGKFADLIRYEGPRTDFWWRKADLYDNIALTGFDPRRICWDEIMYDPANNKSTTFAKEPSPPKPATKSTSTQTSRKKRGHGDDSGPDSISDTEDEDRAYSFIRDYRIHYE